MNEQLQIQKEQARLSIIGECYPDALTNSGDGDDIAQELIDVLEDLDIDLPDFDPEEWDDIPVLPGFDEDGDPILIYIDPDTGDIEIWELDIDPLDFQDILDDLELTDICPDLDITGLDINGLDSIVTCDTDLILHVDNLPTALEIVTMPKKLRYIEGTRIDLSGMIVKAVKADGSTWTSAKYPNGHIPLGELITEPLVATEEGKMAYNFDYGFFCHLSTNFYDRTFTKTSWGKAYGGLIISPDGWHDPVIVSDDEAAVRWHCEDVRSPIFTRDFGVSGSTVVHGLRVYYGTGYGLREGSSGTGLQASGIDTFYGVLSGLLESIVAGDGMCKVVIRWERPGDSKELWTSFDVEVIPKGHGGGR